MKSDDFKKLLEEALDPIKETQKKHGESLENLKGAVISIESKLDAFADSYKINQHNIERVDIRLTTVEENLDIDVPEDLKVPHFSTK